MPRSHRSPVLEKDFQRFSESATAFVKLASAQGAVSYRGDPETLRDIMSVTKKVFSMWSVEIILTTYTLKSVGFGDLRRLLRGISSQVLSRKLRDLEELGLLQREVIGSRPPKVRYALSQKGVLLAKIGEPVILYLREAVA